MTQLELSVLLVELSILDGRKVPPEVVEYWHPIVGHLDVATFKRALILHLSESDAWTMPVHILRGAARLRSQLALAGPVECTKHPHYPMPCDRCAGTDV